jgi:hypothetical protein
LPHLLAVCWGRTPMPVWSKVLGNGTIRGEKPLGVPWRFEPLHAPLALTRGLVGVLGAVIEIPMLAVFYPQEHLPLGGPIAFQFVGNEYPRDMLAAFEELAQEGLGRVLVPPTLHEDIQHVPVLIDGPPEIVPLPIDGEEHLIKVPFVTWSRPSAPELIGIGLPKLPAPLPDRFIGHDDSAGEQQFFHIAVAEAEAEV